MTTAEKLIKNKLGLLQLASYLQNVSEACRVMGYSRDTFYRVKKLVGRPVRKAPSKMGVCI